MTDQRETENAAAKVRELRAMAEIASPRQSVLAALDKLDLQPGMRVLDAGCGPGVHLPLFAERVAPGSVIGVDQEAEQLAIAEQVCADLIVAGSMRIALGDVNALPLESESCDVAWASAVLHHQEQPLAMLAEMVRVTKPGGLVAILDADYGLSFPMLPWPPALEERIRTALGRGAAENFGGKLDHFFDPYLGRKLPRLLREAGLIEQGLFAFSDLDRAPLARRREEEIRDWFRGSFGERLRDYLPATDLAQYGALFDAESANYLLRDADFFMTRTYLLALGHKPT